MVLRKEGAPGPAWVLRTEQDMTQGLWWPWARGRPLALSVHGLKVGLTRSYGVCLLRVSDVLHLGKSQGQGPPACRPPTIPSPHLACTVC